MNGIVFHTHLYTQDEIIELVLNSNTVMITATTIGIKGLNNIPQSLIRTLYSKCLAPCQGSALPAELRNHIKLDIHKYKPTLSICQLTFSTVNLWIASVENNATSSSLYLHGVLIALKKDLLYC